MPLLGAIRSVLADAIGHFNRDDGWALASHVALSVLMALFPFLIFVTAVAGFAGSPELATEAARLLFEAWPADVAEPVAREIEMIVTFHRLDLLTVGILLAIFLASNGVEAIRIALNRAYRARETRSLLRLRAQSVLYVVAGAVGLVMIAFALVVAPLAVDAVLIHVPALVPVFETVARFRIGIALAVLSLGLIACHYWLPAARPPIGRLWPGVLLTLVFWIVGGAAFGVYIARFASYASTYAGLAGIMTAIVFLYLAGVAVILGAELNAAIERHRRGRATP